MTECEEFTGRLREICEGTADLPLEKTNAYRAKWGLAPFGDQYSPREMPSLARQAWNLASSLAGFVSDGFKLVGKEDYQKRLEICDTCEYRQDSRCLRCGCYLAVKAKVRADRCPENKWPMPERPASRSDETSAISAEIPIRRRLPQKKTADAGVNNKSKWKPTGNWISAFKPSGNVPEYISTERLAADTLKLIPKLPPDISRVIGVARSGLTPATLLAMALHLPITILRHHQGDWMEAGHGWRLSDNKPRDGKILVVDDTTMTGNSLRRTQHVLRDMPCDKLYAAVYVNPAAIAKPDLWVHDLPWPHLLEWNLFNSVLIDSFALDFDGILCRECRREEDDDGPQYLEFLRDATPLHLVRKRPIKLIVTARLEKYLPQTLEWMNRWGVRAKEIVMGPWKTERERRRHDVAKWKAGALAAFFKRSGSIKPKFFIESDPRQAKRIAELTGRLVVCPPARQCFGKAKR